MRRPRLLIHEDLKKSEQSSYHYASNEMHQTISNMKKVESPKFENGRLLRQIPLRHKLPKSNFYYNNEEFFKDSTFEKNDYDVSTGTTRSATNSKEVIEVKSVPECIKLPVIDPRKSSLVQDTTFNSKSKSRSSQTGKTLDNGEITNLAEDFISQEYNTYQEKIPSKNYLETYIRRDAAKWKSTPVPGIRTCEYFDMYRRESTKNYSDVYQDKRGVLPKYGGYVPGLKFRYGSPFGQLTYNARELGMERNKSRTWGGAVSLF